MTKRKRLPRNHFCLTAAQVTRRDVKAFSSMQPYAARDLRRSHTLKMHDRTFSAAAPDDEPTKTPINVKQRYGPVLIRYVFGRGHRRPTTCSRASSVQITKGCSWSGTEHQLCCMDSKCFNLKICIMRHLLTQVWHLWTSCSHFCITQFSAING